MNREIKLKQFLTNTEYKTAIDNSACSPLTKWFAEVLEKSMREIDNFDLIRCIRQNIFIDEVVDEIIIRLIDFKFYADDCTVELMEKLATVDISILKNYKEELSNIFFNIENNNLIESVSIWMYEEEKEEFREYILKIKLKVGIEENFV